MKQKYCNIRKQSGVVSVLLVFLLGVVSGAVYWIVPISPVSPFTAATAHAADANPTFLPNGDVVVFQKNVLPDGQSVIFHTSNFSETCEQNHGRLEVSLDTGNAIRAGHSSVELSCLTKTTGEVLVKIQPDASYYVETKTPDGHIESHEVDRKLTDSAAGLAAIDAALNQFKRKFKNEQAH